MSSPITAKDIIAQVIETLEAPAIINEIDINDPDGDYDENDDEFYNTTPAQSKIDDMLIEFILIKRKISALKEADVLSSAKKIKKFEHNYCMLNKANKEQ